MAKEQSEAFLSKLILFVSIMAALIVTLAAAIYLAKNNYTVNPLPQISSEPKPTSTPVVNDETADWKTYGNEKYGFELKYPFNFRAEGNLGEAMGEQQSISIRDFDWNRDAYSFPFIKVLPEDKFFMQIYSFENNDNLTINEWLNKKKDTYNGPEKTQIIGYYKQTGGELISEKDINLGNESALQRIISYNDKNIQIKITYTYIRYKNKIYQFISHSNAPNNIKMYNQILSTFKFIDKESSFSCSTSTVTDIDNNIYNTVKIGDQCWLKENLKVTKNPEGKPITRYCYNNDPKICETDGGLYDWDTAMNNSTEEGSQGICPNGWHVPKKLEWQDLENKFVGNNSERGIDRFETNFNSFNFFTTDFIEKDASFWISTKTNNTITLMFTIIESTHGTFRTFIDEKYKTDKYLIRCLKD